MSHLRTRDGEPSHARRTCPKCATGAIRTIEVPWYPELEYLSCDTCHYVWTVERASANAEADVMHDGSPVPLVCPATSILWQASDVSAGASDVHDRGATVALESERRKVQAPKRIQRQRIKGWRLPPNSVYVGRGTKWGPPWLTDDFWWATNRRHARTEVYKDFILRRLRESPAFLVPLRGKDLACWCPLDQPCHADVLLDLANR